MFSTCRQTVCVHVGMHVYLYNNFVTGDFCGAHYASMLNRNHKSAVLRGYVIMNILFSYNQTLFFRVPVHVDITFDKCLDKDVNA